MRLGTTDADYYIRTESGTANASSPVGGDPKVEGRLDAERLAESGETA
jgi:hypothetical protein